MIPSCTCPGPCLLQPQTGTCTNREHLRAEGHQERQGPDGGDGPRSVRRVDLKSGPYPEHYLVQHDPELPLSRLGRRDLHEDWKETHRSELLPYAAPDRGIEGCKEKEREQEVEKTGVQIMKEISLTQGKVAFVDDEDFLKISKFRWYAHPSGNTWYAVRSVPTIDGKQRTEHMHVIIAGTPEGMETDHINGNGLDNRRENLRIVTTRGNAQNRHTSKTSKYPGVSWDKCRRKWRAQIRINGKVKRLGLYRDEETAGMAYALACNSVKIEETP